MNGKLIYFALAAIVGLLAPLISFLPFIGLTLLYHYVLYRYKRFSAQQIMLLVFISLLFLCAGSAAKVENRSHILPATTNFHLEYIQNPKIDGDLLQVFAYDTQYKEKLLIRYEIKTEEEQTSLKNTSFYQLQCKVSGTLEQPKIAKNPNGFDYRRYLKTKKVFWLVDLMEGPLQNCSTSKSSPMVMLKDLRYAGIRYLENHFPPDIASLSAALIFGDQGMLDPQLLENYQKIGIVHLLAISGLHVSLLIGMFFYLGLRLGMTRQFMANLMLLLLPAYAVLTGGSPSVIRSVLMMFLIFLTVKWGKHLHLMPVDAISLACIVYLLINPLVILDIGFQLSFAVSFAIILSARHILMFYPDNTRRMLVTSIISQLAALPILFYHYFELSLIGIIANMLYIPLFSFVYLPGLYILFIFQLLMGKTPEPCIHLFVKLIQASNKLIDYLGHFSFATLTSGRPDVALLVIYGCSVLMIFYIWETRKHLKWKTQLAGLALLLISLPTILNWLNPFGMVTMIDVGQGDSFLIHLPHGKENILIDTGGTLSFTEEGWRARAQPFEVGRDVVVPYLKGQGITRIDMLVLTHGDMDHIGGAFSIIKELEVKEILMGDVAEPSSAEAAIQEMADQKGIPVVKVSRGDSWKSGSNEFYILGPEVNFSGERNSGSIAIYTKIGGLSWFFGGDLDQEGEQRIIGYYPELQVDVLKAGHHGSKSSSCEAFIEQIKPKVALISAGEQNRYGHPHQEVLDRLKEMNTAIYRTDKQGAVTYRFFHESGTFSTYLPYDEVYSK